MKFLCLIVLTIFGLLVASQPTKPLLKGVTILYSPFVMVKNEINRMYTGFAIELLDKISEKVGFEYELYQSPDGEYGAEDESGKMGGMIGEVEGKKADFAIGDLVMTENRKRHVTFTEPFLTSELAAIVHKNDSKGLRPIDDLLSRNEELLSQKQSTIGYQVLDRGAVYWSLSKSNDSLAKHLYEWIRERGSFPLVPSHYEGIARVKTGRLAFLVNSNLAEFVIGHECNLRMILDIRGLQSARYAIAMAKDSPYLERFSEVIREMKADGSLEELRKKYWVNRCEGKNS